MIKRKIFLLTGFLCSLAAGAWAADISLSINGSADVELPYDKPALVAVTGMAEGAVRFEAKDADKKDIVLAVRPLAVQQDYIRYFGIDPQELAKLKEGSYELRAFAGQASSKAAVLRMKKGARANDDTEGLFYRLDKQFEKLLAHSERMIQKNEADPPGWIYKGDALEGLGRDAEALAAYRRALKASDEKIKKQNPKLVESPVYIQDRIVALLRKKSGA